MLVISFRALNYCKSAVDQQNTGVNDPKSQQKEKQALKPDEVIWLVTLPRLNDDNEMF